MSTPEAPGAGLIGVRYDERISLGTTRCTIIKLTIMPEVWASPPWVLALRIGIPLTPGVYTGRPNLLVSGVGDGLCRKTKH